MFVVCDQAAGDLICCQGMRNQLNELVILFIIVYVQWVTLLFPMDVFICVHVFYILLAASIL